MGFGKQIPYYIKNNSTYMAGDSAIVGVGGSNYYIKSNDNGLSFIETTTGFGPESGRDIVYNKSINRITTVGFDGYITTSDDLANTWNITSIGANPMYSIALNSGTYVAVGGNRPVSTLGPYIYKSTDGINFTSVFSRNFTSNQLGVWYGSNKWITCGENGYVVYSSNLTTFTASTTTSGRTWRDGAYSADKNINSMVASANNGGGTKIAWSVDGMSWTNGTIDATTDWLSVDYSPKLGLFVAVGANGTNNIAKSTDGKTYTVVSGTSVNMLKVKWITELNVFYATTNNASTLYSSVDGTIWNIIGTSAFNSFYSVVYAKR